MNNEQTIKHIASQLFEDIDEEYLNLVISYFKDEDDGIDIFMSLCFYSDTIGADEDYKEFSLSDWNQVLEGSKSQHKLSKDILLDIFWVVASSGWSGKSVYTNILSKSLDYCIPF